MSSRRRSACALLESNETWIVGEGGYDLSISADGQRTDFF